MQDVAAASADNDVESLDKKKKKPAKVPATCADNKDKRDCTKLGSQEGDCAWCEGGYMPASCMSAMAAKYLPEMVAKCKLPKRKKVRQLHEAASAVLSIVLAMRVIECSVVQVIKSTSACLPRLLISLLSFTC
jgi:hypothetical protein